MNHPVMNNAVPANAQSNIALVRGQAYRASVEGRYDDARALLESALVGDAPPNVDVLADLAAVAFQQGELVRAIDLARKVAAIDPGMDVNVFTLALSLSSIGSHVEAISLFSLLSRGERGERFKKEEPDLAAMAQSELTRLRALADNDPFMSASIAVPAAAPHKYDFSHLTQPLNQKVGGPIQDDEALLLYSVVRGMRVRRVLEIGGLGGYSARNFLQALKWDVDTAVYTVDINPVNSQASNHFTIQKDVAKLQAEDVHNKPLDLVFFDCHVLGAQMNMFVSFVNKGLITDDTIIALHDTNLHPRKTAKWSYAISDNNGDAGFVHQDVERKMVNELRKNFGYDAFCLHTRMARHDEILPTRHGVTLMKKFVELRT